jgi:hypothetical protein
VKVGAENRTKLFVAIGLMAIAVIVLLFNSGGSAPKAAAPAPVPQFTPLATSRPIAPTRSTSKGSRSRKPVAAARSLDPTLRYDWLKASEDTEYEGKGRNIFMTQAEIPQPTDPGNTDGKKDTEDTGPPPPPPPPPINLKFFGFANKPGESKKIFLSEGEDVFIAGEGDVVNRHYKVLHISPTSVEIEDVLNNNRQNIPLTG